jgi:hypothetical protein
MAREQQIQEVQGQNGQNVTEPTTTNQHMYHHVSRKINVHAPEISAGFAYLLAMFHRVMATNSAPLRQRV